MKKTIIRIVAVAMLALMVLTALPAFAYNIVGTAAAQTPVYKDTKGRKVELYVSGPVTINRQDNKSGMYNVTVSYDGKTYTGWVYPSAISGIGYDKSTGGSASGSTSGTTGGTTAQTPAETPIPKVEEKPTRKPSRVYLTFYGAPDKNAPDILDALKQDGRTAAFFLPADTALWTDDTVRRIVAEGHTAALLLEADEKASGEALTERLTLANERLRLLFAQIPEIIREEETLAMKLRVHDDIGHSILAARRVLLQHADQKEIRANAALWEQSISVLYRSSQITAQSEPLEAAKKRAEELGVRVLLTGDEPQTQRIRALSALAICECAANCVRHADGTELYVRFWRKPGCTEVALTNNGAAPKEKITEGGGLSMLRQRIKEADGKMEVQSIPRFKLMLSLPEQEEAVYESDDR